MNSNALTKPAVRPEYHFMDDGLKHSILDMRPTDEFGADLHLLICRSVKDTQLLVGIDLPDHVIFSHKQFISVEANTQEMDRTVDRIYLTPYNVMEVIVDQDYQTVDGELLDVVIGYEEDATAKDQEEALKELRNA